MEFEMDKIGVVKLAAIAAAIAMGSHADAAVTRHFSFRPREIGIGGGASVVAPVPKPISDAYDRGLKQQRKELSIVGKVTEVVDAGTIVVTPNGGGKHTVRFSKICAPKGSEACAEQAAGALRKLLDGKKVTVKYLPEEQPRNFTGVVRQGLNGKSGDVSGVVWYGKVNVNLSMVRSGFAKSADAEYDDAQRQAKLAKLGVWADAK